MPINDKPKVLLIYPGNKSMGFTYPMGLLYIAKALLNIKIDVSIFHMGVDNIKKLKHENYLFVGISMLTGEAISNGLRAVKLIKAFNDKIPIVLGGVHPSLLPEESLKNELIDIVVIGEGDETIQELAMSLLNNQDLSNVRGIAYKDSNKRIIRNQPRDFIDMNKLDFDLPYELLGKIFFKSTIMPVHTSRGCPYRCSFCYNTGLNKRKYRYKSSDRVVDEIEYLYKKYNITNFNFDYEDEFFIDPKRAYEIFSAIRHKGLKIHWSAFCRFDTFDNAFNKLGNDFIDVLKKSGCYYLSFGAESGSQRLLDVVIRKDIRVDQIFRTVERLKNAAITHRVSFICCFPTETQNDLNLTFDVIDKISYDNPRLVLGLFKLVPLPGTQIYDLLKKDYNYKTPSSLEGWGKCILPSISSKDVTWLPRDYAKMCHNLSLLANHPFYKDFRSYKIYKEFVYNTGSVYEAGHFGYIMAKIQRWRYRNKFFKLMIEIHIFNKLIRLQTLLKSYFLKKHLSKRAYQTLKKWFGKNSWCFQDQEE